VIIYVKTLTWSKMDTHTKRIQLTLAVYVSLRIYLTVNCIRFKQRKQLKRKPYSSLALYGATGRPVVTVVDFELLTTLCYGLEPARNLGFFYIRKLFSKPADGRWFYSCAWNNALTSHQPTAVMLKRP
jgi:hypothetical protein